MNEQQAGALLVLAGSIAWAVSVLCLTGWSMIEYANHRPRHALTALVCATTVVGLGLLTLRIVR